MIDHGCIKMKEETKTRGSLTLIASLILIMLFASTDVQDVCAEQVATKPQSAITAPSIRSKGDLTRLGWYSSRTKSLSGGCPRPILRLPGTITAF